MALKGLIKTRLSARGSRKSRGRQCTSSHIGSGGSSAQLIVLVRSNPDLIGQPQGVLGALVSPAQVIAVLEYGRRCRDGRSNGYPCIRTHCGRRGLCELHGEQAAHPTDGAANGASSEALWTASSRQDVAEDDLQPCMLNMPGG